MASSVTAGEAGRERAKKPHLVPLTAVRFFAAFHVVLYHNASYLEPLVPGRLENVLHTGYSGGNLFFVLSGCVLAYTYLHPDERSEIDRRRFWVARFARIYPVYLLSLGMVAPFVIAHFAAQDPPAVAALKVGSSGFASAALIQAWIPPLRSIWNAPGWTLSAEAFFYACFPLLVAFLWRLRPGPALAAALGVWGLGQLPAIAGLAWLGPGASGASSVDPIGGGAAAVFLRSAPIFRLHEFVIGILLARVWFPLPESTSSWRLGRGAGSALVWTAAAGLLLVLCFGDRIPRLLVHAGILDPLYAALIVGLSFCGGLTARVLSIPTLRLLGEASYGIYILHIPIRIAMLALLGESTADRMGPLFFLLYAAVVIGASVAAFLWLEDPARRWIRRRFAQGALASVRGATV